MTDNDIDDATETDAPTRSESIVYEIDSSERPSEAVVRAVSTLTGTPVLDLNPLYDAIDPEHLNGTIDGPNGGGADEERSVTFRFNECRVTVNRDAVRVGDLE